jgi:hypothetical protein
MNIDLIVKSEGCNCGGTCQCKGKSEGQGCNC